MSQFLGNVLQLGAKKVVLEDGTNATGTWPISITGTASLADSGVVAGEYTAPTLTVDAKGRITTIANGVTGLTGAENVNIATATATVATTSLTTVATIDASLHRSAEMIVTITQGSNFHATKLFVLHDGTNTWLTEHSILFSSSSLASFSAVISGSNLLIQTTQGSATSADYKIIITSIYTNAPSNDVLLTQNTVVSTTALTTIATIDASLYRSVEASVTVTLGSDFHATKLFILHNGTDTWLTEHSTLSSNGVLTAFSAVISGNDLLIQAAQSTSTATYYKCILLANSA